MTGLWLALLLGCQTDGSTSPSAAASVGDAGPEPASQPTPMEGPVTSADQARASDGQTVTLVGIYKKRMIKKGMPRPGRPVEKVFLGHVQIELEGEGEGQRIQLGTGKRPDEEIERLADKKVQVSGRLVMEPAVEPGVATTRPRPTLMEPSAPELIE